MSKTKARDLVLDNLRPEELEPRLELQILMDPMASLMSQEANNKINCEKGSNCCANGGTCEVSLN